MILLNRQVCFYRPPTSDIVVFDETNSHYITDFILDGFSSFTYNMRPEKIYISFSLVFCFIKSLRNLDWQNINTNKITLRTILGGILRYYRLVCFQFIDPKIVITFIDNDSSFHWLAEKFRSAQFFAIQNGNRTIDQLERRAQYHQHFFSFGNHEKDLYKRFSYTVENCHPVGSIAADYYKYKIKKDNSNVSKYDLCVVSGYPPNNKEQFKSVKLMDTFLAKYLKDQKILAAILMRTSGENINRPDIYTSGHDNEKSYYENLYGNNVELIKQNKKRMSTYEAIVNSDVVIGFMTTTVCEAFGWGKKVLYCDFTSMKKYHDFDPMIMFTEPIYEDFKRRLDELRREPIDKYRKRTNSYASYLMNYNPDCPPHIYIREKIKEYL